MAKITITEALAEIKTINKRLVSKREFVLNYLCQEEKLVDPLLKDGGAEVVLLRERQGISDLEQRIVDIRAAIAKSNDATLVTINSKTRSMTEWLAWRRDVSANEGGFLNAMRLRIAQERRAQSQAQPSTRFAVAHASASTGERQPANIVVFVNEQKLAQESEQFEDTLGQLDGKLSLLNATTFIELK